MIPLGCRSEDRQSGRSFDPPNMSLHRLRKIGDQPLHLFALSRRYFRHRRGWWRWWRRYPPLTGERRPPLAALPILSNRFHDCWDDFRWVIRRLHRHLGTALEERDRDTLKSNERAFQPCVLAVTVHPDRGHERQAWGYAGGEFTAIDGLNVKRVHLSQRNAAPRQRCGQVPIGNRPDVLPWCDFAMFHFDRPLAGTGPGSC